MEVCFLMVEFARIHGKDLPSCFKKLVRVRRRNDKGECVRPERKEDYPICHSLVCVNVFCGFRSPHLVVGYERGVLKIKNGC